MTTAFLSDVRETGTAGAQVWTGRVLSGLAILFLGMDTVMHLLHPSFVVAGTVKVGYPASVLPFLGIVEAVALVLYIFPRTSVLGAIVWTGYLGGAVATHVRVGDPLFSHILAPVYVAIVLWGGLVLRDVRLRAALKGSR